MIHGPSHAWKHLGSEMFDRVVYFYNCNCLVPLDWLLTLSLLHFYLATVCQSLRASSKLSGLDSWWTRCLRIIWISSVVDHSWPEVKHFWDFHRYLSGQQLFSICTQLCCQVHQLPRKILLLWILFQCVIAILRFGILLNVEVKYWSPG